MSIQQKDLICNIQQYEQLSHFYNQILKQNKNTQQLMLNAVIHDIKKFHTLFTNLQQQINNEHENNTENKDNEIINQRHSKRPKIDCCSIPTNIKKTTEGMEPYRDNGCYNYKCIVCNNFV